jgi:hypothetical protein
MAFTRLGYLVMLTILATAIAAIAFVLWPRDSSDDPLTTSLSPTSIAASPAPDATAVLLPTVEWSNVVNFTRLGAVVNLEQQGQRVIVNFRPDFDTSGLNTESHTVQTVPPAGRDVEAALRDAGIGVNEPGGVEVIRR